MICVQQFTKFINFFLSFFMLHSFVVNNNSVSQRAFNKLTIWEICFSFLWEVAAMSNNNILLHGGIVLEF